MKTNPNHKAFTIPYQPRDNEELIESGLTKREYFAALAMQGLIAKYGFHPPLDLAVRYADDLIEELNKDSDENT